MFLPPSLRLTHARPNVPLTRVPIPASAGCPDWQSGEKKDLKAGKKRKREPGLAMTGARDGKIMERLLKRGPGGKHVADPGRQKKVYGNGEDGESGKRRKKGKSLTGKNRRPPTK